MIVSTIKFIVFWFCFLFFKEYQKNPKPKTNTNQKNNTDLKISIVKRVSVNYIKMYAMVLYRNIIIMAKFLHLNYFAYLMLL